MAFFEEKCRKMKKSCSKIWWNRKLFVPLQPLTKSRALSSAGLEHLPYKQRVGGSNPSAPTGVFFPVGHTYDERGNF